MFSNLVSKMTRRLSLFMGLVSFTFMFFSVGISLALSGILPDIEAEFGLSDSSVSSLASSLYMGVKSLSGLLIHFLILKTGLRNVALLGGILLVSGLLTSGL